MVKKRLRCKMNKKKGFTLIELLSVVLIFSILLGIGVYSLKNLGEISSEGEAQRVVSLLKVWREVAISTQSSVMVGRNQRGFNVTRIRAGFGAENLARYNFRKLRFGKRFANLGVEEANRVIEDDGVVFPNDCLIFDRRGGAVAGAFYLTDGRIDFAIGVTPSGRIKLWRWRNGNWREG
ncbi:MAG: prepilin-type N-terminal cleavage/methylation domain-containing protein [Candidatus Hydrothermales bacterium]